MYKQKVEYLTHDELVNCFNCLVSGKLEYKSKIVESFIPLVLSISNKYKLSNNISAYNQDDIINSGMLGLVKAINSFDINKYSKENAFRNYAITCINNEIKIFLRATRNLYNEDKIIRSNNNDDNYELEIVDVRSSSMVSDLIEKDELYYALSYLDENEKEIIYMHFYLEYNQTKIANILGVSQSYVSRLIKVTIRKLRYMMNSSDKTKCLTIH